MTSLAPDLPAAGSRRPLLDIESLGVVFRVYGGQLAALDAVSLSVAEGETVGLVGESGSGKTTLARCVVGLQRIDSGAVFLEGAPLAQRRSAAERRAIQIVFQDPFSSLNPRLSVRAVLRELLSVHGLAPRDGLELRCRELVELVGLAPTTLDSYPGGLSGGQRQRVAIARALAVEPRLLIADEPTSALDVSVQAAVLDLFEEIRSRLGVGVLFISHNLAAVRHLCERVAVMYLGKIVESGTRDAIFSAPAHPYTRALLSAAPRIRAPELMQLPLRGEMPSAINRPAGCAFAPRCPRAEAICATEQPSLEPLAATPGQLAACHFRDEPFPGRTG